MEEWKKHPDFEEWAVPACVSTAIRFARTQKPDTWIGFLVSNNSKPADKMGGTYVDMHANAVQMFAFPDSNS